MAITVLQTPPHYDTIRSEAGAFAVDPAVVNIANYPPTDGADPGSRRSEVLLYWDAAAGVVNPLDWLDVQLLVYDGINTVWSYGQTRRGIAQREVVSFLVEGASCVYPRVVAFVCAAGQNLRIRMAAGHRLM